MSFDPAVTIAVAPINDPPVAQDDNITTAEANAVEFNVMDDNDNGADSPGPNEGFQEITVISFDTTGTVGTVELLDAETGDFRYTPPNADYNGTTSFTYTIQDNGQSRIDGEIQDDFKEDTATVTITVTEVNDAPTAEDVRATAVPILRHRIIVNHRAVGDSVTAEQVAEHLLQE